MFKLMFSLVLVLIISVYISRRLGKSGLSLTPVKNECPFCYGDSFCKNLTGLELRLDSFEDFVNHYVGVKNVFVMSNNLVLKKLGHEDELEKLDEFLAENAKGFRDDFQVEVEEALGADAGKGFKLCNTNGKFLGYLMRLRPNGQDSNEFLKNVWTILQINAEPIILQDDTFPTPKYMGACGRLIAMEYAGKSLIYFKDFDFFDRAYLSLQLLKAAEIFTDSHADFRFYLTDISADNVVVDANLQLKFVDLEGVIIADKSQGKFQHASRIYDVGGFAYSQIEICESSISDHNFYAVCRLLLSKKSPWPMMSGGLLHSVPTTVLNSHPELPQLIEYCAEGTEEHSRFEVAKDLSEVLTELLEDQEYFHD